MSEPTRKRMRLLLSILLTASMIGAGLPALIAAVPSESGERAAAPRATDTPTDLIVPDGEIYDLYGFHCYTKSIQINGTLKMKPYDGIDDTTGTLSLAAPWIIIGPNGKIVADGRGYGGGGGGQERSGVAGGTAGTGGKGGNGAAASGYWGAGGGGGSNGGLGGGGGGYGYAGSPGTELKGGDGGNNGGHPTYGGKGGTGFGGGGGGGGGDDWDGGGGGGGGTGGQNAPTNMGGGDGGGPSKGTGTTSIGSKGGNGGYMAPGQNGDSSTDSSILRGSGGGGGAAQNPEYGGGGGGGAGGGSVSLVSEEDMVISGTITTTGGGGGTAGYDHNGKGSDGGGGAGGGILLSASKMTIDGSVDARGRDGDTLSTVNGGTVKVFFAVKAFTPDRILCGRLYENFKPSVKLISPEPDTAVPKPVFTWNVVDPEHDPIVASHLQVSPTREFKELTINKADIKGLTYEVPDLLVGTEFFWRVRAAQAAGWGAWSETWRFLTDNTPPDTRVLPLPKYVTSTNFTVTWMGIDEQTGVKCYDVYVSDNTGEYRLWLNHTAANSGVFPGTDGHKYRFYTIGTDLADNMEDIPEMPDTTTTVDSISAKCILTLAPYQKTASFSVNWSATDSISGVSNYTVLVSDNGGLAKPWLVNTTKKTEKFVGAERHLYLFSVRTRDIAGNIENITSDNTKSTKVDFAAPETSVVYGGMIYGGKPVYVLPSTTIALSARDDNMVNVTRYQLDGKPIQVYILPFKGLDGGSHNVTFWSVDPAGNEEKRQTLWFFVDGESPLTALTFEGQSYNRGGTIYVAPATIFMLDVQDLGSGVASTEFHFDNMDPLYYSEGFALDKPGSHTLYFLSVDNLGNREVQRTQKVVLDQTAPTTIAVAPVASQREDFSVKFRVSDTESGGAATYFRYAASGAVFGEWETGTQLDFFARADHGADGAYVVEYYSIDYVGNTENTKTVRVTVDTQSMLNLSLKGTLDTDQPVYILKGQAEPGSRVVVNGLVAQVGSDGYFTIDLELKEGANKIVAVATDPAGNSELVQRTVNYKPLAAWPDWMIWALGITIVSVTACVITVMLTRPGRSGRPRPEQRV